MDPRLQSQSYLFDFRDILGILRTDPALGLNEGQYEDLAHFIIEEMALDFNRTIKAISVWGFDTERLSTNFYSLDPTKMEKIREAMFSVANQLWLEFKNRNMFDYNNHDNLTFPFVMTEIVGSNLMLMKDNVLSSNEVKIYGNSN